MKAKNIQELRDEILEAIAMVKADPRRLNQAESVFNGAGKAIAASKAIMEYAYMRGELPDDPFMGKTSGIALKSAKARNTQELQYSEFRKSIPAKTGEGKEP